MEHSLKPLLPKLLLITPLVALQPLNAQSVNNSYATYYTVLNNPLYRPNHPNFSLLSTVPLLNSSQSVPLTKIEIKPVIKQPVIPLADARFNQWGEAGLILRGRSLEKILPSLLEFSMVFPLFQQDDRFLLTQLHTPCNDLHGKQTAYSLGFGQRFWPLNQAYWWGTHLFYDLCPQGKHHRLGLVGEWQNSHTRCTVNGYFPLSQWRLDEQNQLEKRPALNLDFRLQWFLFQKPHVNLNVLMEHAFSHSLTYPNQSTAHPTVLTLGLSYTPVSLVTISYDAKMAHKKKSSHQLQIQFTYRLGIPLAQQFNPAWATTGYDPATNRLSLIQRQSTMLLEQRETSPPAAPATLPVPPTSAEETEQKPSESTPQDLNPTDEEVDTGQQKPNDTAANPDHHRASLSDNTPKPAIYPTLSPLTTPEGREPSREQKDTTTHLSPIHCQSMMPLEQREIPPSATLPVPPTSAEETEQKPSENTPQAKKQSPKTLGRRINDNHLDKQPYPSITNEKDFAEVLNATGEEVNTGQQKPNDTAANPDHRRASVSGNTPKSTIYPTLSPITTPGNHHSLAVSPSKTPLLPQKTNELLNSSSRVESHLEKNSRSGTNTPNSPHSDFSPKSSGHSDDSSKVGDHGRPMRARHAPQRFSYSPDHTGRKTHTTQTRTKHPKTSKMKNQQPQDSDLLTTQTSLGDEEHTEQPQKPTIPVYGAPGSPNIPPPTGPSPLHNNKRFSLFSYPQDELPSTYTQNFEGKQPEFSTALPTRRTARSQKPNKLFTPTSDRPTRKQPQK